MLLLHHGPVERARGIAPRSPPWQDGVLAVVLRTQRESGSPCGNRTRVCSLRKSHPAPRRTGHREIGRPNGICTRVPQVKTGDPELLDDEAMENDPEKLGPVIRLHPVGRTLIFSWMMRALWEATRTVPRKRTHPSIPLDSGGVGLVRRRSLRSWLIGTGLSGEATKTTEKR